MKMDCPADSELEAFDRGLLPEPDIDRITAHLEAGCTVCEKILDELKFEIDEFEAQLSLATLDSTSVPLPEKIGRYEIEAEIGRGGMGVVYRAFDPQARRTVALKRISSGEMTNRISVQRFHRETEVLAKIDHPNVVSLYDCGVDGDMPFLVFELVNGLSLEEYAKRRLLPSREAAVIIRKVATAIQVCHNAGVLHRDIKPANILLTEDYEPKISDFGLSRAIASSDSSLTRTGTTMGTPQYMSPEQAIGDQEFVSVAMDVYSLGATLYELITGRPPHIGTTLLDLIEKIAKQEPQSPRRLNPVIHRDLETICLKCLEKKPANRYELATDLAEDLSRFLEGRPILARPVRRLAKVYKWCRRNPVQTLISAVLTILLVTAAGLGVAAYLAEQRNSDSQRLLAAKEELHEQEEYFYKVRTANSEWENNRLDLMEKALESCPQERRNVEWHLLNNNCLHQELLRITNTDVPIIGLHWSPDGKTLAISRGNEIEFWDVKKRELDRSIPCPTGSAVTICWGKQLVAVRLPKTSEIELISLADGTQIRSLKGVQFDPKHGMQLAFDATGQWLAGGTSGAICVWDVDSGAILKSWNVDKLVFCSLKFHPSEPWLATFSARDESNPQIPGATLWEIPSGKRIQDYFEPDPNKWPYTANFSPDGKWIVTGTMRDPRAADLQETTIWDVETGKKLDRVAAHTAGISAVKFHPTRREILTAGFDSQVYLREYSETGEFLSDKVRKFRSYGTLEWAEFNLDGSLFATSDDQGVHVWDYSNNQGPLRLEGLPDSVEFFSVAISPDGKTFAAGGSRGSVKLIDIETGKVSREFFGLEQVPGFVVFGLAFSPDGKRLAGVGRGVEKQGVLWDVKTGEKIAELTGVANAPGQDYGDIRTVAFDPSGKMIVTGGNGGLLRVWNAVDGSQVHEWPVAASSIAQVAFSPDGRLCIVGESVELGGNNLAAIVDPTTGQVQMPFDSKFRPTRVAFSPDPEGRWIAFVGNNHTIRVLDSRTLVEKATLSGHGLAIKSIAFHPNGNRLFSCSNDYTVRIWDIDSSREIIARHDHPGGIESMCLSRDGQTLVTGGWGNTTLIWDISPK